MGIERKFSWEHAREGIAYVGNLRNTITEFLSLPSLAKAVFAFLLVGLAAYFVLVGDYSFWGWLGIVGLVFSSINLVLVDNGKLTSYLWGTLCSICSLIGAVHYQMYGDVAYYVFTLPALLWGIGIWVGLSKGKAGDDGDDTTQSLSLPRKDVWKYAVLFVGSYIVMFGLSSLVGGAIPWLDSLILSCGVVGQIFLSKSYRQQWVMWISQDVIAVTAWSVRLNMALAAGEDTAYALSMVVMWGIFTVNAIYGCWQWYHAGGSFDAYDDGTVEVTGGDSNASDVCEGQEGK